VNFFFFFHRRRIFPGGGGWAHKPPCFPGAFSWRGKRIEGSRQNVHFSFHLDGPKRHFVITVFWERARWNFSLRGGKILPAISVWILAWGRTSQGPGGGQLGMPLGQGPVWPVWAKLRGRFACHLVNFSGLGTAVRFFVEWGGIEENHFSFLFCFLAASGTVCCCHEQHGPSVKHTHPEIKRPGSCGSDCGAVPPGDPLPPPRHFSTKEQNHLFCPSLLSPNPAGFTGGWFSGCLGGQTFVRRPLQNCKFRFWQLFRAAGPMGPPHGQKKTPNRWVDDFKGGPSFHQIPFCPAGGHHQGMCVLLFFLFFHSFTPFGLSLFVVRLSVPRGKNKQKKPLLTLERLGKTFCNLLPLLPTGQNHKNLIPGLWGAPLN